MEVSAGVSPRSASNLLVLCWELKIAVTNSFSTLQMRQMSSVTRHFRNLCDCSGWKMQPRLILFRQLNIQSCLFGVANNSDLNCAFNWVILDAFIEVAGGSVHLEVMGAVEVGAGAGAGVGTGGRGGGGFRTVGVY